MYILEDFKIQHVSWLKDNIVTLEECKTWSGNLFSFPFVDDELIDYCCDNKHAHMFMLFDKESNEIIGHIRIGEIDEELRSATIQNVLIGKKYREKGFGYMMILMSCIRIFKNYNIKVIRLRVKAQNIKAIKTYRKVGFKILKENSRIDSYRMILTYNSFIKNAVDVQNSQKNKNIINWYKSNRAYFYNFKDDEFGIISNRIELSFKLAKEYKQFNYIHDLAILACMCKFIQHVHATKKIFIINYNGGKYICIPTTKSFYQIFSELKLVVSNNICVPPTLNLFRNNSVEIAYGTNEISRDINISFVDSTIYISSKFDLFNGRNIDFKEELTKTIQFVDNYDLSNNNILWEIFTKNCNSGCLFQINGKTYPSLSVVEIFNHLFFSFKRIQLNKYRVDLRINDPLIHAICYLCVLFIGSNIDNNKPELLIIDNNNDNIFSDGFVLNVNDIIKNKTNYIPYDALKDKELLNNFINSVLYSNILDSIKENNSNTDEHKLIGELIKGSPINIERTSQYVGVNKLELQSKIKYAYELALGKSIDDTNANFFWEGGDSLTAMKLIMELEFENIRITLEDLYKYPNIELICAHILKGKDD